MAQSDICCIGHITLDKIVTPQSTVYMPGGTAFYFAHGISRLNDHNFTLVTSLAKSEMKAVDDIRHKGIQVVAFDSPNSVYFENTYGDNPDNRTQRVLAKASPFTVTELADIDAKYFHLGTLLADDFPLDAIKLLSTKGIVSVDAQGYLRKVEGQKVVATDWPDKLEALRHIDILKVNEHEGEVLAGTADPLSMAKTLSQWGVKEVIVTLGSNGSLIYAEDTPHYIPAYVPGKVVDATGCGDTYMTGYLYMRSRGADYDEAGRFAAAMCTIKLEASGPFDADIERIREVMNQSLPNK